MRKRRNKSKKFSRWMQKKLIVFFVAITLVLVGLIARLMDIEYNSGEKYEKIVLSQQQYDSKSIPYQRGDIVDTKGTVLATSVDVYNVVLDCKVLNQNEKDIDATISALAMCFSDLKEDELHKIVKEQSESQYVVLAKKLPYETVQPFVEMQTDDDKYPNINDSAVWFEKEYIRKYPYDTLAASVVGFVSGGNVGTTGLENYYNSTLNGVNGRQYGYLNSDNNFEKTIKEPKDGNTIVSTIDTNIQSVVEEKLAKYNAEFANGFVQGDGSLHTAALVMNPQNGEVLAMANYPTFNLNQPREFSNYFTEEDFSVELADYIERNEIDLTEYTEKEIEELHENVRMNMLNGLWENFCITHTYEPGSTAKPFTVATGLETGTLLGSETYLCDGLESISGHEVHCVSRVGHGIETIEQSLMDSCNDALMQMSYAIGVENFTTYQSIFGFGKKTGIDLPGEARTDGLLFSSEKMQTIDLATNSFGQNFNCTMLQLASAFSSLVNGGKYYQPHMVKKILDADGNTIETIKPVVLKETVSEETSEMLKQYMYATVSEGTATTAKVDGYSMGGKTGTAQKIPRADKTYLVSFIGYLPQENPELVVYVVVDEPNVEDQAHSTYAQNIAKEILTEILPYMNIYPDEEKTQIPEDAAAPEGSAEGAEGAGESQPSEETAEGAGESQPLEETVEGTAEGAEENPPSEGSAESAGENPPSEGSAEETGENPPSEGTAEGAGDTSGELDYQAPIMSE